MKTTRLWLLFLPVTSCARLPLSSKPAHTSDLPSALPTPTTEAAVNPTPIPHLSPSWFEDAVVYEVFDFPQYELFQGYLGFSGDGVIAGKESMNLLW
jgi:hypothetical protein